MRAAVLRRCGEPPTVGEHPDPVPGEGGLLVRVTAASITPLDLLCASGTSYFGEPATPYVPGVQGVGTLPDGTSAWFGTDAGMRPGDGSMAELAVVPAADVVALPEGLDHAQFAAMGLSAVAAHMAMTGAGELRAGERVLVLGGGGVVGQTAIQLALLAGAADVVAAARSEAGQARARQAGATHVVPLRDGEDFDGPFDLVLDPLCGVPAAAALRALRPGGRLVNLGSAAGPTMPIDSATLRSRSLRVLGYTNTSLTREQRATALTLIASHALAGTLTADHAAVRLEHAPTAWLRRDRRMVLIP
jgi:NADPH:quinone reductase